MGYPTDQDLADAHGWNQSAKPSSSDPYVEAVKNKLDERSKRGRQKYGTDLTRTDLTYSDWLLHAQEEAMDLSLYLERLQDFRKEVIKDRSGDSFRQLQTEIYQNAVAHGFWEPEKSMGENIALMHSELSEALEEYRNGKPARYFDPSNPNKPEGIFVEFADVIIRIMDAAEHEGVDLWALIVEKHEYNKTREFRHGNKAL